MNNDQTFFCGEILNRHELGVGDLDGTELLAAAWFKVLFRCDEDVRGRIET